jgi:hypothetical protein
MAGEQIPQIEWRFPLAGLPLCQRHIGQQLPNHLKFISVQNHVVVPITWWLPFSVSPPVLNPSYDQMTANHNIVLLLQTLFKGLTPEVPNLLSAGRRVLGGV